MRYSIRNAVAVTKHRAEQLKKLTARQRVIDKERRFLSSAAGRRAFPKYERAPEHLTQQAYIYRHQRRMMDFRGYDLRRAFRPKGKYHKSKTMYPRRVKLRIRAKPVYTNYGRFIKILSDGRRLHQFGVKPR